MVLINKWLLIILILISWFSVSGLIIMFFRILKIDRCKECNVIVMPEVENYCSNCGAKIIKEDNNNGE